MSDNVVNFNKALQKATEDEQNCVCSHCEFKQQTIQNFNRLIKGKKVGSDGFNEEVDNLMGFVEMNAQRNIIIDLIEMLSHQLNHIDGINDDEDEEE